MALGDESYSRRFSRRSALLTSAATLAGLFASSSSVIASQKVASSGFERKHDAFEIILRETVADHLDLVAHDEPGSVVRVVATDPVAIYDLSFGPGKSGSVERIAEKSVADAPHASVRARSETYDELLSGSLNIEQALASRSLVVSGDREKLAFLAEVPYRGRARYAALLRETI